tara:strand:- start:407 stop:592 length:186 start_codon:yes stop_codon:yes gene_type:complete
MTTTIANKQPVHICHGAGVPGGNVAVLIYYDSGDNAAKVAFKGMGSFLDSIVVHDVVARHD